MGLLDWLNDWATRRALDTVRAAAAMRAAATIAPDPAADPLATEAALLGNLTTYGPQSLQELRMGVPGGVSGACAAIERLAGAGRIRATWDGRWSLP